MKQYDNVPEGSTKRSSTGHRPTLGALWFHRSKATPCTEMCSAMWTSHFVEHRRPCLGPGPQTSDKTTASQLLGPSFCSFFLAFLFYKLAQKKMPKLVVNCLGIPPGPIWWWPSVGTTWVNVRVHELPPRSCGSHRRDLKFHRWGWCGVSTWLTVHGFVRDGIWARWTTYCISSIFSQWRLWVGELARRLCLQRVLHLPQKRWPWWWVDQLIAYQKGAMSRPRCCKLLRTLKFRKFWWWYWSLPWIEWQRSYLPHLENHEFVPRYSWHVLWVSIQESGDPLSWMSAHWAYRLLTKSVCWNSASKYLFLLICSLVYTSTCG